MYLVSVIIPCYNGEKYLENMMSCLISQSIGFENLEVIIVDDCSTDNSKEIIQSYARKFNNVKDVYHQKNSGCASITRNTGIKHATADYLLLEDVDDFIMYNSIEILYNTIKDSGVDFIKSDELALINDKLYKFNYCENSVREYDKSNAPYSHMGSNIVFFSRKFIEDNNILFKDTSLGEDILFVLDLMVCSNKKYYVIPEPCHVYTYKEEKSLTHDVKVESVLEFIDNFDEVMEKSENFNEKFRQDAYTINISTFYSFIFNLREFNKTNLYSIFERLNKSQNDYLKYSGGMNGYFKLIHSLILKKKYFRLYILFETIKVMYRMPFFVKMFRFKNFTELNNEEISAYYPNLPEQVKLAIEKK